MTSKMPEALRKRDRHVTTYQPARAVVALLALLAFQWLVEPIPASAQDFAGREKLRAHSQEFRREVIRVTDGVYVAVGFFLGNTILIEGTDGLIVVDTAS